MDARCTNCGQPNRVTSRYCASCGQPLAVAPVAPAGPIPSPLVPAAPVAPLAYAAPAPSALPGTQRLAAGVMLLVVNRPNEPELTYLLTGTTMTVGRDSTCDVVIDSPTVSHLHAVITAMNGTYVLRDQGSTNGIYAFGQRVTEAPLHAQEPVRIPDPYGNLITLTLRRAAAPSGGYPAAIPPATADQTHVTHHLDAWHPVLTIGRDPANDVTLDLPLVSRRHACVEQHGGAVLLRDLNSTNGTYVNGQRVRGTAALQLDDEIRIGSTRFVFRGTTLLQFGERPRVRLDAVNLVRHVGRRGGNVILNDVSLSILPREFVALVGSSGAGKSTLLNALSGTAPAQAGLVLYNGHDFYRDPGPYRGMIGYVPQDDILHRDLPVERALDYAAQLRLPPDTTGDERKRRIDGVLADVKMEPQRHQMISKLSGGQRKRISIAVELLANPSVLFLDEPTSGLDPGLDKTVMSLLQLLCDKGHTIVLVTHATENIGLCNLVAYVAGRGRLVYYGPPSDAPAFFGVSSFSDIYSHFDQQPDDIELQEQHFRASPHFKVHVLDRRLSSSAPAVSIAPPAPLSKRQLRAAMWRQWRILTARYAELLRRDRVNLGLLLAQAPIVAVLLTLVADPASFTPPQFFRTEQLLLMLTLAAIWFGTINAAREIVKERAVYLRERAVNVRIAPYVLSKFSVLSLLSIVQSLLLLLIVTTKTPHLPAQGILLPASLEMYITLVLTSLAGMSAGLLVSSLVSSADRAMSIVPVVLIAQVIFSGGVFDLQGAPGMLSWLAMSRWCLAALGSIANLNHLAALSLLPADGWPKVMYSSPDPLHLWWDWLILALFSVVFLLGTYAALLRKDSR